MDYQDWVKDQYSDLNTLIKVLKMAVDEYDGTEDSRRLIEIIASKYVRAYHKK